MRKHGGLSLLELLVSINIIVFGIFIMAVVMCMLLKSGQKNLDNSSAYIVADSVLKEFIAKNKYDLNTAVYPASSFTYGDRSFRYQIECKSTGDNLYYIKATVFSSDNKSPDVVVSTLQRRLPGGSGAN